MDRDPHAQKTVHQFNGIGKVVRLVEKDLVHPVSSDIKEDIFPPPQDRDPVFLPDIRGSLVHQDDPGDEVVVKGIVREVFDHLVHQEACRDDHQGPLPLQILAGIEHPFFIGLPDQEGGKEKHHGRDTGQQTGDHVDLVDRKEVDQIQKLYGCHVPEGTDQFRHRSPPQDVFVALGKEHDDQLADYIYDRLIAIQNDPVGVGDPPQDPVTGNIAELEDDQVQDQKIQMLEPAFFLFFIHTIVSLHVLSGYSTAPPEASRYFSRFFCC